MKKACYTCLICFFQTVFLSAQTPAVCNFSDSPAADNCNTACIYCQLQGYSGQTSGYSASMAPGFCGTVQNDQWLAFIAGDDNISITVTPSNCQQGDGLETALYGDCTSAPIACTPGQQGNGDLPSVVSAALTPGQTYFLMINGYAGDACDFTISTGPANAVYLPQVGPIGPLQGPSVVAENSVLVYSVDSSAYATSYRWTGPSTIKINGQTPPVDILAPAGRQVMVTFGTEGGLLSVQASNVCSQGDVSEQRFFIGKTPLSPPCPSNMTQAANNCSDACVECDFSGYTGATFGYTANPAPGFCSIVENNQWIGFVAGANAATFTLTAFDCIGGNGLQMALYQNCTDLPVVCAGGQAGGAAEPLIMEASLQAGQNYFLMVDGFLGDQCNFNLTVNPPMAAQAPPMGTIGPINGLPKLCPGATATYSVPAVSGAAGYSWQAPPGWLINGKPGPYTGIGAGGNSVTVTASANGGQLSVFAFNSCAAGSPITKNILVQPIPPTNLPTVTICAEDAPYILPWGGSCPTSATHCVTLSSYLGCDSVVCQQVIVKTPIITFLPPKIICPGDSFVVCGESFSEAGMFSKVCENYEGCDSTVNFILFVSEPLAEILPFQNPVCAVSSLVLNSAPSTGTKTWKLPSGDVIGSGDSITVTQSGVYILETTASAGNGFCSASDTILVQFNDPPTAMALGGTITCNDPAIQLDGSSGTPGAGYAWTGPDNFISNEEDPEVSVAGNYVLTVTDPQTGCTTTAVALVLEDTTAPTLSVSGSLKFNCVIPFVELPCPQLPAGSSCVWSGPGLVIGPGGQFQAVDSGFYQLVVTGPNGCTATSEIWVEADIQAPVITAYADTVTCANPSVMIHCTVDMPDVPCSWTFVGNSYLLTATAPNGCSSTATLEVVQDVTAPMVSATGDTLRCDQPSATLVCMTDVPGALFDWSGPGGFSSTLQNPTVAAAGSYTVLVTNPGNGCMASATASVFADLQIPQITVTPPGVLSCTNTAVTLFAATNIPQATFQWTGPNGFMSDLPNPTVSAPGPYTVTVVAPSGCMSLTTVFVSEDTLSPELSLVQITPDQNGQGIGAIDISIVFAGMFELSWYLDGEFYSNSEDLSGLKAGTYEAVVTGSNGCTATLQVIVLDTPVSTNTISTDQFWEIAPNPTSDLLQLRYRGSDQPEAQVWLLDATGRVVLEQMWFAFADRPISCAHLPAGVYTMLIRTKGNLARKLVAVFR